ncbi:MULTISPECIES: hypothetical protein [unclassified Eikenella]|uniref:hypothetical protein n=1 Tax=unclassified Eikenella TaxID=2639367 RepID=UPI000ACADAB2|nr:MULTISPECIES: hypothetical protein [unclassified Eikenella]
MGYLKTDGVADVCFAAAQHIVLTSLRLRFQVACSIISPTLPLVVAAEEPLINITS